MALDRKTVLFAWELGEGLGHLPPLKAIAEALRREGATVAFALRDPVVARVALAEIAAPIVQAPSWPSPAWPEEPIGTYADVLLANGYGTAAGLSGQIAAWGAVLDQVKPDLVVCEHAPTAALAAFGRVPVAFVGNGFVVPPTDGDAFPSYVPGDEAPPQSELLETIREALAGLRRSLPTTLCEPFRGVFRGIYCFREIDTYRHIRVRTVMGPIESMPPLKPPPAKPRLFAYSAADYEGMSQLVQGLMDLGPQAGVYFRGASGARASVLRTRGVKVWDSAPVLSDVVPEASVVFSHGGTGFANAALAAGRPHVVAPRHLEAQLTARRLATIGAGLVINGFNAELFRSALAMATEPATRDAALEAGAAAQAFLTTAAALERTVEALRQVLQ